MLDRDVYILWQFFESTTCMIIILIATVMLLVEDSGVLLQVRCYCTSGVGWEDVESAVYIESTYM